ncbi:hypothetical protein EXIGLDRAFT_722262 [Exidia glandulosa HHB12029]|uniref:Uncharacterized protein n=1 Tax=Exidia glandulosa HHB12029 TaxID=1314781 RepID=A0A165N4I9_EXIGL|nr:hypothetical protein EXIGLDRAFT_722262 [Exidia glandulosa HHB12029]
MVDTHTTTNTSSSPSALTAAQHALLDASLFQVRSLLTGTETRVDSANDTAGNNTDDDQLQTVAANANPARVSLQSGLDSARHERECAGARGRQEARTMSSCDRRGRLARRATSAPPMSSRTRAHLEGVRTPMKPICSSAESKVEHGSLTLLSVVELGSPEMLAVEHGSRGEVEHGSPHSLMVEHGSQFSVVERGSPNNFNGEYGSQHALDFVDATQNFERTGHTPQDTPFIANGRRVDSAYHCLQEVKSTAHDVYSAPTTLSVELEMEDACTRQSAQLLCDSSIGKYPVRVEQGSPTVLAIELGSRGEVEQGSLRIEQGSPMSNTLIDVMYNDTSRTTAARSSGVRRARG